jgi:hypothetical protein
MLEAWLNTGMAAPHTMASTTIAVPEPGAALSLVAGIAFLATVGRRRKRRLNDQARLSQSAIRPAR